MKWKILNRNVLSPTVIRLGLVSFFADISSEMLYPITPLFLTTVLGASMTSVGLIEGLAEFIASGLKTYSGAWSDRIQKRTRFIWIGYGLAALAKPLIGLAHHWPMVLAARGLDRTGKGIRSAPRDALLSESVEPKFRGAAFGWHRLMDTLGAAVGPLLALIYLNYFKDNLREIYFWALIPGVISVAIALRVKELPPKVLSAQPLDLKNQMDARTSFNSAHFSPAFKKYLLAMGIFSITNSSDVFLLLRAKQQGISLSGTILLYCFYNLIYAIFSPYFGGLSDRIGRKWLLVMGFFVFSLVYLGFALAVASWQYCALFSIYGLYMAATDGVSKAGAVDLVPENFKATGLGFLGTVTGIGALCASIAAGFLWDHAGSASPFYFGACGGMIAGLCLLTLPNGAGRTKIVPSAH